MNCYKCKNNNSDEAKFCTKCGSELSQKTINGSVDTYFAKQERGCQICGSLAPTKNVEFNQNIGMLVSRQYCSMKGRLCKNCINREFSKKTLTTLFLGWWGTISFFVTPFYLLGNLISYLPTIGMEKEEK
jgi:hypothetical protein